MSMQTLAQSSLPVEELKRWFGDGPEDRFVNYAAFNLDEVKQRIQTEGYAIVHELIPPATLEAVRDFWLRRFKEIEHAKADRVTWSPYLGQPNTVGFTDDKFQCMFRSCDFLWNPPYDQPAREVGLRINALRNLIVGFDVFRGTTFSSDRYGVFITTSYYPPHKGWLGAHSDGVASNIPLVHHIVPLTIKGRDYAEGGLTLVDRQGKAVDADGQMRLGSVLFYDGSLKHGVEKIVPSPDKSLGRMQMFAIPTTFSNVELNVLAVGRIATSTFMRAKWMRVKNRLITSLGLSQIIR